jgi:hypothetical protein
MTIKPEYPEHIKAEHRAIAQYDIKALQELLAKKYQPLLDETSLDKLELSMQKITPGRVAFIDYLYTIENYDGNRGQKTTRTLNDNLVFRCLENYTVFKHFYDKGIWSESLHKLAAKNLFCDRQADMQVVDLLYREGIIKLDAKFFLGQTSNSIGDLSTYIEYGLKHDCLEMNPEEIRQMIKETATVLNVRILKECYEKYPHLLDMPLEEFFTITDYRQFGQQFPGRFKMLIENHPARIDTYVNLTESWFRGISNNTKDNFFILCEYLASSHHHSLEAYCTYVDRRLKKIENKSVLENFLQHYDRIRLYKHLNENLPQNQEDNSPEEVRKMKI